MKQIKTILIISLILVFFLINTSCRDNTSELNPQLGSQKSSLLDSQIIHQSNLSSQQILRADISGKDDLWADKRLKIGFVGQGYAGEWYSTLVKDMLNSAEDWNIDIQFKDAGGKKESQKEIIQNFLYFDYFTNFFNILILRKKKVSIFLGYQKVVFQRLFFYIFLYLY